VEEWKDGKIEGWKDVRVKGWTQSNGAPS
jgi:hypothetical protein